MLPLLLATSTLLVQAAAPPAKTQPAPTPQTLAARSLVLAELGFARKAAEENTQAAFVSVLDEMGVLFRPGPVNGKAWFATRPDDGSKLSWFPSFVEVSQAGDLGFSTGPFQWCEKVGSEQVIHGHFVSIWGRRNGTWKLLLDTGLSHDAPGEEDPVFEPENLKGTTKVEAAPPFSAEALQNREKEFSNAASVRGLLSAYSAYLAPEARFYRPGTQPTTDLENVRKALQARKGNMTWAPLGGTVAKSNDLGYTYGISEFKPAIKPTGKAGTPPLAPQSSMFLHVWKRQPTGHWKVVLDIENPLPPGK